MAMYISLHSPLASSVKLKSNYTHILYDILKEKETVI